MANVDILSLLTSDRRFVKNGSALQKCSDELSKVLSDEDVIDTIASSLTSLRNIAFLLNLLLYTNKIGDSAIYTHFDKPLVMKILDEGVNLKEYESISERDLRNSLGSDYLDFKDLVVESSFATKKADFLKNLGNKAQASNIAIKNLEEFEQSDEYWVEAVNLDFPSIPQPDSKNLYLSFNYNNQIYSVYEEAGIPETQSQITALTDVNKFSNSDILKLFPKVRLYTRSSYMYQEYDGLDYDEDLGVILKITGYTKKQIIKNIIEYPHISNLERQVKIKGQETTIPFWKYIELDGEIVPTASVWGKLKDTKKLPQTESFMNEYVVRKYILDLQSGKALKYKMRGTLLPFLTLYAPPEYYERYKYDPIEIGKACIESRKSFKFSRNPVINLHKTIESIND